MGREMENKSPVANPIIVLREEFDDWAILFDPDTGNAFGLNPTGVFIWKLLDGRHSPEEILKAIRENAEDVPEEAGQEICDFIVALESQGLVGYEHGTGAPE
jgi:SynChlorMet cassette protein ScmD